MLTLSHGAAQTLVGWLASLVAVRLVDGRYSQDTKVLTAAS
jgi:hypothetical protein